MPCVAKLAQGKVVAVTGTPVGSTQTVASASSAADRRTFEEAGFQVLTAALDQSEVVAAAAALAPLMQSAETDAGSQFAGATDTPFWDAEVFRLASHPRLVSIARNLLDTDDLRIYAIEAWAKVHGAAEYEQAHHRDNHSPLAPSSDPAFGQVELFVLLTDVTAQDGPIAVVPNRLTDHLPHERLAWHRSTHRALYDNEVLGVGPAGTVIAFRADTIHRATALTRPRGTRLSLSVNFRPAAVEWHSRTAWGDHSFSEPWDDFVNGATYEQLLLFGFPPTGHPYWTEETLSRMKDRYSGLDLTPWAPAQ